jgi:hypothetical protein
MYEYLIIMVRMIVFSYEYSKESGYAVDLDERRGISPQDAMLLLFGTKGQKADVMERRN